MATEKVDQRVVNDDDNKPYFLSDEEMDMIGLRPIPNHLRTKSYDQVQRELAMEAANKGKEDGN